MVGPEALLSDVGYSAAVLSSEAEIQNLQAELSRYGLQNDILLNPAFFLASVAKEWMPKVVVVRRGSELAGMVGAKERLLYGLHLGIAYADLTFGSTLLGDPQDYRSEEVR